MDTSNHKEFRVSNDGSFIAVGSVDCDVCVIRIADNQRYNFPRIAYDFGGQRLAVDTQTGILFAGAYYNTGIAAYEIETGNILWQRRDLKKLQHIAYDSRDGLVYCAFEGRATKPLNARDGRERQPIRGLKSFYFSRDCTCAIFEGNEVRFENRATGVTHVLPRLSWGLGDVAFATDQVVVSWIGGPVVSYHATTGKESWRYPTEGVYSIALSVDDSAVWVVEQPYEKPPWHRLRLLSTEGKVLRTIRCSLGFSFELLPYCDKAIRADVAIVSIDMLETEMA